MSRLVLRSNFAKQVMSAFGTASIPYGSFSCATPSLFLGNRQVPWAKSRGLCVAPACLVHVFPSVSCSCSGVCVSRWRELMPAGVVATKARGFARELLLYRVCIIRCSHHLSAQHARSTYAGRGGCLVSAKVLLLKACARAARGETVLPRWPFDTKVLLSPLLSSFDPVRCWSR